MGKKKKSSQKINDILNFGLRVYENAYNRVTNYWDLMGERHSEQKRHRDNINKRLNEEDSSTFKDTKEYLASCGLVFGEIPIYKAESEDHFKQPIRYKIFPKTESSTNQDYQTNLQKVLQFKDESLTSDRNYEKSQKVLAPHQPTVSRIKKERLRQNKEINKYFTKYRNDHGSYVDCAKYISYQIKKNFEKLKIKDETIQVKLSGDGTQVGKKIKCLNFSFTLPDSGLAAKTVRGNFTLGIFKIKKENQETLKEVLFEVSKNLEEFSNKPEIFVNNNPFKVKFLLGGDMKFLHEIMGLSACNSSHSCYICKAPKEDFFKNDLKQFVDLKRSTHEQTEKLKSVKKKIFDIHSESVEGYLHEPIFKFIPYENVIFDTLHLSLRLPGKLIKLVMHELKTLDNSTSTNIEDLPYQKQFFHILELIGINSPYSLESTESNGNNFLTRTFNGNESLKIMESFDFEKYFPSENFPKLNNKKELTSLFQNFYSIFMKIKNNYYVGEIKECEKDTENWLKNFLKIFHTKHVTPYVHLFVGKFFLFYI